MSSTCVDGINIDRQFDAFGQGQIAFDGLPEFAHQFRRLAGNLQMKTPQCAQSDDGGWGGSQNADVFRCAFSSSAEFIGYVAGRTADAVFIRAAKDDSGDMRKRWSSDIVAFGQFMLGESDEIVF